MAAVLLKAHERGAEVSPAGVNDRDAAAKRQLGIVTEICGDHGHIALLPGKAAAHILKHQRGFALWVNALRLHAVCLKKILHSVVVHHCPLPFI